MQTAKIYCLIDALDRVFYIGQTTNEASRLTSHYSRFGRQIEMLILDEIPEHSKLIWESFYIDLYKSWGFKLQNKYQPSSYFKFRRQKEDEYFRAKEEAIAFKKDVVLELKERLRSKTKRVEILEKELKKDFKDRDIKIITPEIKTVYKTRTIVSLPQKKQKERVFLIKAMALRIVINMIYTVKNDINNPDNEAVLRFLKEKMIEVKYRHEEVEDVFENVEETAYLLEKINELQESIKNKSLLSNSDKNKVA